MQAELFEKTAERSVGNDPLWLQWTLIGMVFLIIGVLIVVPVINIFWQAFANGWLAYLEALFGNRETLSALTLTLIVAPVAVVVNTAFGIAAGWAIARFRFPGRTLLLSLIDLPFSISPVVAGLSLILLFGIHGWFGGWLYEHDIRIIFALPGLILATMFVTVPFIARELIPVMEAIGDDEEVAAMSLGARGWTILRRITFPNIRWGLMYGVILCSARAMSEFGAAYVVSGHIAGRTDTLPLRIDKLFHEYDNPAAFAVASLLTLFSLFTLFAKVAVERKVRQQLAAANKHSGDHANVD
jgi:sulfate transport system permease protein